MSSIHKKNLIFFQAPEIAVLSFNNQSPLYAFFYVFENVNSTRLFVFLNLSFLQTMVGSLQILGLPSGALIRHLISELISWYLNILCSRPLWIFVDQLKQINLWRYIARCISSKCTVTTNPITHPAWILHFVIITERRQEKQKLFFFVNSFFFVED